VRITNPNIARSIGKPDESVSESQLGRVGAFHPVGGGMGVEFFSDCESPSFIEIPSTTFSEEFFHLTSQKKRGGGENSLGRFCLLGIFGFECLFCSC
jgi:hypothetical protein